MKDENVGKIMGIYKIYDIYYERAKDGHLQYCVQCIECGYKTNLTLSNIKTSKICKHTLPTWNNKRISKIFNNMKSRCYNINDKDYRFYGAKGIKICDEWLNNPMDFETWAVNNGYDNNLTIDRIDANRNYSPSNCRWIPLEENVRRAGKVNWITVNDCTLTGKQWSKKLGLGTNTINTAIRQYGIDKTKELIKAILEDPIVNHCRKPNDSWFSVYNIKV